MRRSADRIVNIDPAPPLVIRGVTVIPGTGEAPLGDATILIRGDRIEAVGPAAEVDVPAEARVVDGRGRWIIPGLVDMHAHLSKTRASSLGLFVVHGVTTVRDLGGDHAELLRWRRQIQAGERLGPRILLAGPYLESTANVERMRSTPPEEMVEPVERTRIPVGSPEEARRVVDSLAALEVDHIKIRTVEDRETYVAINRAAEAHGLDVVGHVFGLPPELILEAGQDGIEHFLYPTLDSLSRGERMELWRGFAEAGVTVVPTLVTFTESVFPSAEALRAIAEDSLGRIEPRRRRLSRYLERDWREQVEEADDERRAVFRRIWESHLRNLREMHEAGVAVLAGSDVAVLNIYPGSSLHQEMRLFVEELGMTPAEAIRRATALSAEALGIADSVGTVEAGKVADLVLLDRDPLGAIGALGAISTVVLRGEPHDAQGLQRIRAAVDTARDQRVNDWPREAPGER